MPFVDRIKLQKDLVDLLEENVFSNPLLRNTNSGEKVHVLFYNKKGYNINPIFIREYLKDGAELIHGEDISDELLQFVEGNITPTTYLGYINYALNVLETAVLDSNTYKDPEKEIKERRKFIEKTISVLERDLGFEFKKNIQNDEEFIAEAYNFLNYAKRRIKVDNFAKIREIQPESDLKKIKAYFNHFLDNYPYVPRRFNITDKDIEKWTNTLRNGESYAAVVELGDKLIGVCALNKIEIDGLPEKTYRISITLLPEYIKMGLGKKLIGKTVEIGKENGVEVIIDDTHIKNAPMNAILRKIGYVNLTELETKPEYYDDLVKMYTGTFGEKIPEKYHIWELRLK